MPEEKILDVSLLTFFGGLIGSRIFYVAANLGSFDSLLKIFLVNKYPGLDFWGGVVGGLLALAFFSGRFKLSFWALADFIAAGIFAGLVLGSFGCLLGSCQSGFVTDGPLAVTQIGLIGTRFPVQFFEAVFFLLGFWYLWKMGVKYHFHGKILALALTLLGLIKFVTEFWRGDVSRITGGLTTGQAFAIFAFASGIFVYYRQGKRSVVSDARYLFTPKFRKTTLPKLLKSCYNSIVSWRFSLNRSFKGAAFRTKGLLKNLNVKSQPPKL